MKVFVANLNYGEVDDSALYELFSNHIDIRSAKVVRDLNSGASRGYGFVELLHDEDLARALELDGYLLANRRIRVAPTRDKNGQSAT